MNDFRILSRRITYFIFAFLVLFGCLILAGTWLLFEFANMAILPSLLVVLLAVPVLSAAGSYMASRYTLEPLQFLWQAIMHVSPDSHVSAPNLDQVRVGRELVTKLSLQVYQFASQQDSKSLIDHRKELSQSAAVVSHLPLPLFVFNKQLLVTHASDAALTYCQAESANLFGKPLFESLNLEFPSERTLEEWIQGCQQNKVTDQAYWERIRVRLPDNKTLRFCDIAAHYNRDNPSGAEFIVTLFDHTERYAQDEESMGFVALAVHELRTPITMLRGYIEVFEEELGSGLDDELKGFMHKMEVSAQQLSSFANNMLNVARIEDNQLVLQLTEEKWDKVLKDVCADVELKAQINGISLKYDIASNLPPVAVDRLSIYEVVSNLIDNAIKYSGNSKEITVTSKLGKEGTVETTVQDFGVGIPKSVLPNLFEKFYRNHRTRTQIGGTGLGLYLCKAIVGAHGGHIWAASKEGQGSTFGFTLLPYGQLSEEQKSGDKGITKNAHGWIKNHSLYRR